MVPAPVLDRSSSNGASAAEASTSSCPYHRPMTLDGGIYCPVVTPFLPVDHPTDPEGLDLPTFERHILRIASAGVGLTILGTNGEAIHVTAQERLTLVSHARKALIAAGMGNTPIIAGTGSGSVKETIAMSKAAAAAGADAVIVIPPGFFAGGIAKDRKALKEFFWQAAEHSPLPVMIYNFPAVTAGIDLDSDLLESICEHPNILGTKLTCANVGKGERLVHLASRKGTNFHVFPGFADILLPSMLVGMTGTIAGGANLFPRLLVALFKASQAFVANPSPKLLAEARELQRLVSRAEFELCKGSIGSTKWAIGRYYFDVGVPRRPLQTVNEELAGVIEKGMREAMLWELEAEKKAGVASELCARV